MATRMTPDDIRTLRMDLGLTQQQLATALSLATSSIQKWEGGRQPPKGLSQVMLQLTSQAVAHNGPGMVSDIMHSCGTDTVRLLKRLARITPE